MAVAKFSGCNIKYYLIIIHLVSQNVVYLQNIYMIKYETAYSGKPTSINELYLHKAGTGLGTSP